MSSQYEFVAAGLYMQRMGEVLCEADSYVEIRLGRVHAMGVDFC